MKLFLSTSFSGQLDSINQEVMPEHRAFIEQLLQALRAEEDIEVFAAIEQENWRINDVAPEVGVQADLEEIDQADAVLAIASREVSAGVQFEMGYALGKGKRVILAHQNGQSLSYFNQGAASAGLITLLGYDNVTMLTDQLLLTLHAPPEAIAAV